MANTKVGLPSIHELPLSEIGGTDARRGFDYQDDVAAAFCLEMLASSGVLQVQCETYDDITLIWQNDSTEKVEFVQVKKLIWISFGQLQNFVKKKKVMALPY